MHKRARQSRRACSRRACLVGSRLGTLTWPCVLQATVEAGYLVLQTVLYVVIVYWMAGFISKPEQFFWYAQLSSCSVLALSCVAGPARC